MTQVPTAMQVRAALEAGLSDRASSIAVFPSIDSTNRYLQSVAPPTAGTLAVCVALEQTAGRGRRGRHWLSPPGQGLCLSVGWYLPQWRADLPTLPLAVGVAGRRAVIGLGARNVLLKWPNDLVVAGGKLGGVLVECRGAGAGVAVVAGIGINLTLPSEYAPRIDALGGQPARDLRDAGVATPDLARAAVRVAVELGDVLRVYTDHGFEPFRNEWSAADSLCDREIVWDDQGHAYHGTARGIDRDGALRVETETNVLTRLLAGDVSVRRVA